MMNGMNHGWGMGLSYSWIVVLLMVVFIIWAVVKYLNQNNRKSAK
jgi:flagellar biogenesis protein FliO